jgi:hypothetical protein
VPKRERERDFYGHKIIIINKLEHERAYDKYEEEPKIVVGQLIVTPYL